MKRPVSSPREPRAKKSKMSISQVNSPFVTSVNRKYVFPFVADIGVTLGR